MNSNRNKKSRTYGTLDLNSDMLNITPLLSSWSESSILDHLTNMGMYSNRNKKPRACGKLDLNSSVLNITPLLSPRSERSRSGAYF